VALEAALCFAFPWSSYYAAEALQLSGIVSILFCGIVMATYARSNLSHHAKGLTTEMFECLAAIAEAFVFNYLGADSTSQTTNHTHTHTTPDAKSLSTHSPVTVVPTIKLNTSQKPAALGSPSVCLILGCRDYRF